MRIETGKILPVLALSFAMNDASAANELVMGDSSNTLPLTAIVINQSETGQRQNSVLGLRIARQSGLTGTSDARSILPAADLGHVPPLGIAKTSALVLSSLGMLGVISLLRLNRAQ